MNTLVGLVTAALMMSSVTGPGRVTRAEYDRTHLGMTRAQVERIFGAGAGCEYVRQVRHGVVGTGRQYKRVGDGPGVVAITYVTRNGVTRVTGRQWSTWPYC